jgi:NAD(P)H-flavin reductase
MLRFGTLNLLRSVANFRYTLSKPPEDGSWCHGVGRIDPACLNAQFGSSDGAKTMVLVCGPPGMCDAVKQWCEQDGWDLEKDLLIF